MVKMSFGKFTRAFRSSGTALFSVAAISYTHELGRADREGSITIEIGAGIIGPVTGKGSAGQHGFEVWIAIRVHRRLQFRGED